MVLTGLKGTCQHQQGCVPFGTSGGEFTVLAFLAFIGHLCSLTQNTLFPSSEPAISG